MAELSDRERIRKRLELDRPWTALALADLDPKYAQDATWFAWSDDLREIVLLYEGLSRPVVVPIGSASEHLESLLGEVDQTLSAHHEVEIVARPELMPLVSRRYRILRRRHMLRMIVDRDRFRPAVSAGGFRLGPDDHLAIAALYADGVASGEAPDAFGRSMLEHGVFYGIAAPTGLSAVAGTHVVAPVVSVAVIGNVYTRRDRRGRGDGTTVTSLVSAQLLDEAFATVALNVRLDNVGAIRVYERLGYAAYCDFYETVVTCQRDFS